MKKLLLLAVAILAVVDGRIATADLCPKCRDLMFTDSAGTCAVCGAATASAALKLCPQCSRQRQQCEHCLAPLGGAATTSNSSPAPATPPVPGPAPNQTPIEQLPPPGTPSAARPAAATAKTTAPATARPKSLDAERPGIYTSGHWKFQLELTEPGTQAEGKWGSLWYDKQRLPHGNVNDYYRSPWGPLYWVGSPQTRWGLHGWMPMPSPQSNNRGRALALNVPGAAPATPQAATPAATPPAAAAQVPQLTRADNGRRMRVTAGHSFEVRLPGNPSTGFRWQAAAVNGQSLRLAAEPQYLAQPHAAGIVGVGGTYVFRFQAVQPGTTSIRLVYVRPWQTNQPPAEAFTATLDVYPAARRP